MTQELTAVMSPLPVMVDIDDEMRKVDYIFKTCHSDDLLITQATNVIGVIAKSTYTDWTTREQYSKPTLRHFINDAQFSKRSHDNIKYCHRSDSLQHVVDDISKHVDLVVLVLEYNQVIGIIRRDNLIKAGLVKSNIKKGCCAKCKNAHCAKKKLNRSATQSS